MSTENDFWKSFNWAYPMQDWIASALDESPNLHSPASTKNKIYDLTTRLLEQVKPSSKATVQDFTSAAQTLFSYTPDLEVLIGACMVAQELVSFLGKAKPGGAHADEQRHKDLKDMAGAFLQQVFNWTDLNTNLDDKNKYRDVVLLHALTGATVSDEVDAAEHVLEFLKGQEVGLQLMRHCIFCAAYHGSSNLLSLLVNALYPAEGVRLRTIHWKETRTVSDLLELPVRDGRVQDYTELLKAKILAGALDVETNNPEGLVYTERVRTLLMTPLLVFLRVENPEPQRPFPAKLAVHVAGLRMYRTWDAGSLW